MRAVLTLALTGCGRLAFDPTTSDTDVAAAGSQLGSTADDRVGRPALDAAGNVYLVGVHRAPITIGDVTYTLGGPTAVSASFVASLAPDLTLRWSTGFGSEVSTEVSRIVAASNGITYVGGYYEGMLPLPDRVHDSALGQNVLVVSYAGDGAFRWARDYGGDWNFQAQTLALAPDESGVAVGGLYLSTVTANVGPYALTPSSWDNPFAFALDTSGNEQWVARMRSTREARIAALRYRADGTLCRAGYFDTDLDIEDDGSIDATTNGAVDVFVGATTATAATMWTTTFGGLSADYIYDVAAVDGDCVFVGRSDNAVELGGTGSGALIVRYRSDGALAWARSLGGDSQLFMVTAQPDGSVLAAGTFRGTWTPDPARAPITASGVGDGVLVHVGADGSVLDVVVVSGSGEERLAGVAVDGDDFVISGVFDGTLETATGTLQAVGGEDMFVLRVPRR